MAPTLLTLGTALLAFVGDVSSTKFFLDETYDKTNFFDKWNFFESDYSDPNYNAVDPTSGYVNYRNRGDAERLGLIRQVGDEMRIGVNANNVTSWPGVGRDSIRIESKSIYNEGLMIARFSHLPKTPCGAWPAFWSFGDPWPLMGELDFYEGWNEQKTNHPVAHTNHASVNGTCVISNEGQTSLVTKANCDTHTGYNEGCVSVATHEDPWASPQGGIYAVEWTATAIKFFSWTWANRPANIDSEAPDTSTWGKPSMLLDNSRCNIKSHFRNHKLVISLTFCGKAAGNEAIWGQACAAKTGEAICDNYVAKNPRVYAETYWQIKDIRHFGLTRPPVTTTTTTTTVSSTSMTTSSSTSTSISTSTSSSTSTQASSSVKSSSSTEAFSSTEASSTEASSTEASSTEASSTEASSSEASSSAYISSAESTTSIEAGTSTEASSYESVSSTEASSSAYASSPEAVSSTETSTSTEASSSEAASSTESASFTLSSGIASSVSSSAVISSPAVSSVASSDVSSSATSDAVSASSATSSSASSAPSSGVSSAASSSDATSADISSASSILSSAASEITSTESEVFSEPTSVHIPTSSGYHFTNSSITAPPSAGPTAAPSSAHDGPITTLTTSTVYTTRVTTVTSCPPYLPDCPDRIGQVVTEVVAITTTVCPVAISTKITTQVHTVTSCPPSVPEGDCPYGSETTTTFLTTVTKVLDTPPSPSSHYGGGGNHDDEYESGHGDSESEHEGGDDSDDYETPDESVSVPEGPKVPTTTEYVYHTATVVPIPPYESLKPTGKNITVPVPVPVHDDGHNKPGHDDEDEDDYPIPETAGTGHQVISAGLTAFVAIGVIFAV